ncbi:hypothetical protein BDM02DRAFT_3187912 [Thelephora ganbajun]|uniref:Uncharacterized protein n=1 Tax=Thelephora ganbajun TaxID=370292 RepID=A0ACB6ZCZ8_THEGA|nr:hypothetical protein BDM02DRAFT_3187912 [Thelephora ganbajun]
MASQAWSQPTLYFPNKDQVIADWILTRFLKEKEKPSSSNPVLDVDHWQLLSSIICCGDIEGSRRVKAWLTPLLNRTPLAPILIAFLDRVTHLPPEIQTTVFASSTPCLSVLWPLAKHKINVEMLLECFSATLRIVCLDPSQKLAQPRAAVCSTVTNTYLSVLTHASNRRKLSSTFLSSHLELWLRRIPVLHRSGLGDLYSAGAETLFSPETLRQLIDDPAANPVIQALSRVETAVVLPSLPALLESFHELANRNRTSLFPHSQQATHTIADNIRASTIEFYNACDGLIHVPQVEPSCVWVPRLQLLSVIEKKNIFSGGQPRITQILFEKCRLAVDELRSQIADTTELILDAICCLSRIDFNLISPYVTSVLSVVAKLPSSSKAAAEFLEIGLDHHKKTRILPAYFSTVLDALEQTTDNIDCSNPYNTYAAVLGGPIFEESHVEKLRKALKGFVTPGQCLGFLAQTKSTLERAYSKLSRQRDIPDSESSKHSHKRRKLDPESTMCSPVKAIDFAFVCNVITIVWPSLPIHSLMDESRSEAVNEIQGVNTSVVTPVLSVGLKLERDEEGGSASRSWSRDIIASSALRLQYALSVCIPLNFQPAYDTKMESRMLSLLESSNVLPELKIEIGRSLLMSASLGSLKDMETLVERLLTCVEPVGMSDNESWGGKAYQLSRRENSSQQLSIALLHVLSHRWLPTLSGAATAEDLQHFIRLLFSPISEGHRVKDHSTQETEHSSIITPLRSPAFWELPELRSAVLSYLNEKTSCLGIADVIKTLGNLPPPPSPDFSLDIHKVQAVYTILRYTPMEYLPKSTRIDLTKKAIIFDGQLVSTLKPGSAHGDLMGVLSLSREYTSRSLAYAAVFDRLETVTVTKYLLDPRWGASADSPTFPGAATERLISVHLNAVIKSYRADDELGMLTIIKSAQLTAEFPQSPFRQTLLTIVLETLMRSSQVSKFSARVCRDLRSLFSSALDATERAIICSICTDTLQERDVTLLATHLKLWRTLISLGAWISDIDVPVPKLAVIVAKKILSYRKTESALSWLTLYNHAILVSLSELSTVSAGEAPKASEVFLAIYVSLSHGNRAPGLNDSVGGFTPFQPLPVHVFETLLTKISEFCSETATSLVDVVSMVRLSQVLLRNAPEGTMKTIQKHTTSSLHLFLNRQALWCMDTNASLEICRFISSVCAERPAALRPGDVMLTWTIVSKLLSGSENHDSSTSTDIFREIAGITSALVRHRRDLVLPALPLLSAVLQRLVTLIRATRPGLGAKQTRTVTNNFPFWVNSKQPLGVSEVEILSRLLVSLTTKTTVRLVGPAQENQKMESLTRPFGKYASYVLVAYVQAVNDPLCIVYAATRKEVYPGLFALCDMLSGHDREAMMLSALDEGGKATMKTLWNDYKKQKYVGQG